MVVNSGIDQRGFQVFNFARRSDTLGHFSVLCKHFLQSVRKVAAWGLWWNCAQWEDKMNIFGGWAERCCSLKGLGCICCRTWKVLKTWKQVFHSLVGLCVLVSCLGILSLCTPLQLNVARSWTFKIKRYILNFLFRVVLGKGLVSNAGCSSLNDSANKNPG